MKRLFAWAGAVALASAALAQVYNWGPPNAQQQIGAPIRWTTLAQGSTCSITKPQIYVMRDQNTWEVYWKALNGLQPPNGGRAPVVAKWSDEQVIAIHLGNQPNAGGAVYVDYVARNDPMYWQVGYVVAQLRTNRPGQPGTSSPFVIIRLDKQVGIPQFFASTVTLNGRFMPRSGGGCSDPVWIVGAGGVLIPYTPPNTLR